MLEHQMQREPFFWDSLVERFCIKKEFTGPADCLHSFNQTISLFYKKETCPVNRIRGLKQAKIHLNFYSDPILVINYLTSLIDVEIELLLSRITPEEHQKHETKSSLEWTDTQNSLVQLLHGIFYAKSLNHGKATLRLIIEEFESFFNIRIKDPSTKFYNLNYRKNIERTDYLIKIENLVSDKLDEKPIRR